MKDLKEEYLPGQQLNVDDMFKAGDLVDIAGKTIGKGFQGGRPAFFAPHDVGSRSSWAAAMWLAISTASICRTARLCGAWQSCPQAL